jgi:competence protein ComEA
MRDVAAPVASEVVRRRLEELFGQLQSVPSTERAPEPPPIAPAQPDPRPRQLDEDEWLDRLRAPQVLGEPPPDSPPRGSENARRIAGQMIAFTKEHLATVIVVLLVGVGWTAYSLLQVRATPVADAAPRVEASPTPAATPAGAGTVKQVVVHVIGAVTKPGVVRLAEGSRVADAISAAGGLTSTAAVGELNLAQPLVDGTQLKVGDRKHPGGWIRDSAGSSAEPGGSAAKPGAGAAQSAKISLNSATLQQLDTLPGIGPVTAQKIIDWRKAHGKFTAITELQEVDGIGPKTYADLAERVRL